MAIVSAIMVPHPPLIIPEVGRGDENAVQSTIDAFTQAARALVADEPDLIVVSSPHAPLYRDYFHVLGAEKLRGSFAQFRAPQVRFAARTDTDFVRMLCALAEEAGFPAGDEGDQNPELDHGTMVPLWFIARAYREATGAADAQAADPGEPFELPVPIVRVGLSGLPLEDHVRFGRLIAQAAAFCGLRVAFVASGDLSHKLREDGPYGLASEGPEYDERIMDVMGRGTFAELLDFDEGFCEAAAECGHRSFCIMAGALDRCEVEARELSHEPTTGVGYGVCTYTVTGETEGPRIVLDDDDWGDGDDDAFAFDGDDDFEDFTDEDGDGVADADAEGEGFDVDAQMREYEEESCWTCGSDAPIFDLGEDAYVRLARASLTSFITRGALCELPADLPPEMLTRRAGAFVSLHEAGELRGCIGTISPAYDNIAEEIVYNAISASTRDPRFSPVREEEIELLEISVDILGPTEPIESFDELDPQRYGVVVSAGRRCGLLLPMLDGVDTVEQQVRIACAKAGIDFSGEPFRMERFEVVRHY